MQDIHIYNGAKKKKKKYIYIYLNILNCSFKGLEALCCRGTQFSRQARSMVHGVSGDCWLVCAGSFSYQAHARARLWDANQYIRDERLRSVMKLATSSSDTSINSQCTVAEVILSTPWVTYMYVVRGEISPPTPCVV